MKTKVYLKIGKEGTGNHAKIRVEARTNHNGEPIRTGSGIHSKKAIPTVFMALELEIPDEAFQPPNVFAAIKVPIQKVGTAIEVVDPLRMI